jgi:outer membrane protein TolC
MKRVFPIILLAAASAIPLRSEEAAPTAGTPSPSLLSAVLRAPSVQALRVKVDAAKARLGSAGRLPDPTLEAMGSRKRMPMENRSMFDFTLQQPLPKAGERAADQDRVRATVEMAEADFAMMAGEMAMDVSMSVAMSEAARQRADLLGKQITRTEQVLATIDARLASGQGRVTDRLALQSQLASMRLMVEKERQMAADAASEARSRLGVAQEVALPEFSAPLAAGLSADAAASSLAAMARVHEASAMARMARASAKPMTSVGLRFSRETTDMGNENTVGLAFMTELPFRGRRYARADERAAERDASASRIDADAVRHRVAAAVSRTERAQRFALSALQSSEETRARLDAEYDTILRSAGVGGMGGESTVLMLIMIVEKQTDLLIRVVDAEAAAKTAAAELWRYAPASAFSIPQS